MSYMQYRSHRKTNTDSIAIYGFSTRQQTRPCAAPTTRTDDERRIVQEDECPSDRGTTPRGTR